MPSKKDCGRSTLECDWAGAGSSVDSHPRENAKDPPVSTSQTRQLCERIRIDKLFGTVAPQVASIVYRVAAHLTKVVCVIKIVVMNQTPRATQFDPQGSQPESAVRVCGLQHDFGEGDLRRRVLFDNNLIVRPGEIVIMTGPSGSGKTTLLTLIGTLRGVQEGELTVLGQPLLGASTAEVVALRKRIGFIFQAHNLFGSLTAQQNVRMALELQPTGLTRKQQNAICDQMLEKVGLGHRIDHKPKQLSGGQKQRVAIARGLVHDPELVLADEPTAALDKESGRTVVELLRKRADEERTTIIMVTHDNRILDVADRIISMVDGRITTDVRVGEAQRIIAALDRCPVFRDATPRTKLEIAEKMHVVEISAGERIITQGEVGDAFYLVRNGTVGVYRNPGGYLIAEVGADGYFGETALLLNQPRNADVNAITDVVLFRLDKEAFDLAMSGRASLESEVIGTLVSR